MSVAEKMKTRRQKLNIKVRDISQKVGVAESTYRDWENGRSIQGEPYMKIANALNMNILDLLEIEKTSIGKVIADIDAIENHVKNIRQYVI